MLVRKSIITIKKKVDKNKSQCDLDKQTAKMSALSPVNVGWYKFLPGKDVLP